MKVRLVVTSLLLFIAFTVNAQLIVDGRQAAFDSRTRTFLATVPRSLWGTTATLTVDHDDSWGTLVFDGQDKNGRITIQNLTADCVAHFKYTDEKGFTRNGKVTFTFLPIVHLHGDIGYDYQDCTVTFTHPDGTSSLTWPASIKWRGGTTNVNGKHKRNYKIKFGSDLSFFGLRTDNNWMLDAGQADVFRLRNRIAMDLWNSFARKPYYADEEPKAMNGVRGAVAEVFLNDEYRGIYNFSEMMDRKQMRLKKADKTTGEVHGCLYKSVSWNNTKMLAEIESYDNTQETLVGYEIKYPDLADNDTVDWLPLFEANNFACLSSKEEFAEHIGDYFDMPVLTDYNIFFNVVNAVDNNGKNIYWAIYDKGTSKRLTPVPWDLDATFGQRWGGQLEQEVEEGYYSSSEFKLDLELSVTYRFFRDSMNGYTTQLNERYRELRQPGQPLCTDSILAIVSRYYNDITLSGAARREEQLWSGDSDVWGDTINFEQEYEYICEWIKRRMKFIDERELPLYYKPEYFAQGINQTTTEKTVNNTLYDLSGRPMPAGTRPRPGIYIRGGRKVLIK